MKRSRLVTVVTAAAVMGAVLTVAGPAAAEPDRTTATLRLREHLRAIVKVGSVETDPSPYALPPRCHMFATVKVQRRSAGDWVAVAKSFTDQRGRARIELEDRPGRYRVLVPKDGGCTAATSNTDSHRH